MGLELESVAFASSRPRDAAQFWSTLLHRPVVADDDGLLLPGDNRQIGLRFVDGAPVVPQPGTTRGRLHPHLVPTAARTQSQWIAQSQDLGGMLRGSGNVPKNDFAAMSDPVGEDFCVIEDGNAYLAGCGPLGEITCEGTRRAGLFWSAVLGWPLVWDEEEETVIQVREGATKLAFSGDAPEPGPAQDSWSFVLVVDAGEWEAERSRLQQLGAAPADGGDGDARMLVDPDGIRFVVRLR